jgi:chitin synthase
MARPHPSNNVSFGDDVPPSRRAGRQDEIPPRPPAKSGLSKTSFQTSSSGAPLADPVQYDSGFVDVGSSNPQGFSSNNGADVRRKKSMVKPERERVDPGHRLWHYREHAAEDNLDVQASSEYSLRSGITPSLISSNWKSPGPPATWKVTSGPR